MKHKSTTITSANMEIWLQNQLKDNNEEDVETLGIERVQLKIQGVQEVDRIYHALFVYSQGAYDSFQQLCAQAQNPHQILSKIWNVYVKLLYKSGHSYIQEGQEKQLEQIIQKEKNIQAQQQEQVNLLQSIIDKYKHKQKKLKEKIGVLKSSIQAKTDQLNELNLVVEAKESNIAEEVHKRLLYETKVNQIYVIYQESLSQNQSLVLEVQQVKDKIIKVTDELNAIQQSNAEFRLQIDHQNQRLLYLNSNNFDLTVQLKSKNIEIDQIYQDKQLMSQQLLSLQHELQNQKADSTLKQLTISNLTEQNRLSQSRCEELSKQLKSYNSEKAKLLELRDQLQTANISLQHANKQLQQSNDIKSKDINTFNEQMKVKSDQIKLLEQNLEQQTLENIANCNKIKEQSITIDTITSTLNQYEDTNTQIYKLQYEQDQIIQTLKQENQSYALSIEQLQSQNKELTNQNKTSLRTSLMTNLDLNEALQVREQKISDLTFELTDIQLRFQQANQQIIKLDHQLQQATTNLTDVQSKYSNEVLANKLQQHTLVLYEQKLEKESAQTQDKTSQLISRNQIINYLQDREQVLKAQIEELMNDKESIGCLLEKTQIELTKLQNYINSNKSEKITSTTQTELVQVEKFQQTVTLMKDQTNQFDTIKDANINKSTATQTKFKQNNNPSSSQNKVTRIFSDKNIQTDNIQLNLAQSNANTVTPKISQRNDNYCKTQPVEKQQLKLSARYTNSRQRNYTQYESPDSQFQAQSNQDAFPVHDTSESRLGPHYLQEVKTPSTQRKTFNESQKAQRKQYTIRFSKLYKFTSEYYKQSEPE